ncbi:MAG: DUF2278 family protein [Planctomycetes bacterium]|nr:DUF2278 family protein [Planctomycetota bacterium]
MSLRNYGVLKGRPINKKIGTGRSPHFQIHIIDDTTDYRISVNVKSKLSPSELLYLVDEQFEHSLTEELQGFQAGFTTIASAPGGVAIDYIRGNLFDPGNMIPLAHDIPGPDNDLNEKISHFVERTINDSDAAIYAFGERWGPEDNRKDKYFGFRPGNGIHDIHMNQGNTGNFVKDDGVWQDGGLMFHFPEQNQWVGVFLAFQSQSWHTDDKTGHRIEEPLPVSDGAVRIVAAKVNPAGVDVGRETVILINTTPDAIDINGWSIADKNKKKEILSGPDLGPGETETITLSGSGAQLSNKGGIITAS